MSFERWWIAEEDQPPMTTMKREESNPLFFDCLSSAAIGG
jgi:hypothetical protein